MLREWPQLRSKPNVFCLAGISACEKGALKVAVFAGDVAVRHLPNETSFIFGISACETGAQ